MRYLSVWLPVLLALACVAGLGAEPQRESKPQVLTVMGHDSTVIPEEVLAEFEQRYDVQVSILLAGDAGSALNRAILAKGKPLADVLYGVDNAFLSRALEEGVFERYRPPALAQIAPALRLDPTGHATPIDFGDVCVNYDITYFDDAGLAPPQQLEDLVDPAYADLLVVQNPAASSPGLAFLLATIGRFGDPGYLDYWRQLRDNGVRVAPDWESAYFAEFSGGTSGGDRPLVVSYGSSPPFEVIYAETPIAAPTTGVMIADQSCFRRSNSPASWRGRRAGSWPSAGSTSCSAPPSRQQCRSTCSCFPSWRRCRWRPNLNSSCPFRSARPRSIPPPSPLTASTGSASGAS